MTMTQRTRFLLAATSLTLAGLAGVLDGQVRNAHDAREMFYLTNPDGPAGNFAAERAAGSAVCAAGTAALGLCFDPATAAADPWVETALHD